MLISYVYLLLSTLTDCISKYILINIAFSNKQNNEKSYNKCCLFYHFRPGFDSYLGEIENPLSQNIGDLITEADPNNSGSCAKKLRN